MDTPAEQRHQWRSVVANLNHIWECQRCGARRNSCDYRNLPKGGCSR